MLIFNSFCRKIFKIFMCIVHIFILGLFFRCVSNFLDFCGSWEYFAYFIVFLPDLKNNSDIFIDYSLFKDYNRICYFQDKRVFSQNYFNGLYFKESKYSNLLRFNVDSINR